MEQPVFRPNAKYLDEVPVAPADKLARHRPGQLLPDQVRPRSQKQLVRRLNVTRPSVARIFTSSVLPPPNECEFLFQSTFRRRPAWAPLWSSGRVGLDEESAPQEQDAKALAKAPAALADEVTTDQAEASELVRWASRCFDQIFCAVLFGGECFHQGFRALRSTHGVSRSPSGQRGAVNEPLVSQ